MCGYSLAEFSNRLANEGEMLAAYRFPKGTIGFISSVEMSTRTERFIAWTKGLLEPQSEVPPCAVCLPPGARLLLCNLPKAFRDKHGVASFEEVTFVETSLKVNTHRDAVQFSNGTVVLLQDLAPSIVTAKVLSLESAEERYEKMHGGHVETAAIRA